MLTAKMVRKDFSRKKTVSLVIYFFIMLSALLLGAGSNLVVELANSLNLLFEKARVPHFVQMHAGELDIPEINRWSARQPLVQEQQFMEMITLDGSRLRLGDSPYTEEESIMDIGFVTQNSGFDFLLDLENRKWNLSPGEIAVSVYYKEAKSLEPGDTVTVSGDSEDFTFRVAGFCRDAQMNPAVVHSKRFLIHESDYRRMAAQFSSREYLIEFRLTDETRVKEFSRAYQESGLPARGPAVDHSLFTVLNALTDGMAAGVVIILSLVLMSIALLCLRFIVLTSLEEDFREIGVMKAVGISLRDVRRIYLIKYSALGVLSFLPGYFLSLGLNRLLLSNMLLYLGREPKTFLQHLIPLAASGSVAVMVLVSCLVILRRFGKISAIEAFHTGSRTGPGKTGKRITLKKSRCLPVNVLLGIKDVFQDIRMFGLLGSVFFLSTCFMTTPLHFLNTLQSPEFISYMGIGRSDIRIDLRQTDNVKQRFALMADTIESDPRVERFSPLVTARYTLLGEDGTEEALDIETGDFSLFPLDFLEGAAPSEMNEIALSFKNSREMDKRPGDFLTILTEEGETALRVTGIYQDVTNGGRTAKAVLSSPSEEVLWYNLAVDFTEGTDIAAKRHEYSSLFQPARVTDLEDYLRQTLGGTLGQVRRVALAAVLTGILLSVMITALFMRMVIAKDASSLAVMRGLGFTLRDLRSQYLMKSLLPLGIGIAAGTLFTNTLGQKGVSLIWSLMGASRIEFVVDPLQAYIFLPLLLWGAVCATTLSALSAVKETGIITEISA